MERIVWRTDGSNPSPKDCIWTQTSVTRACDLITVLFSLLHLTYFVCLVTFMHKVLLSSVEKWKINLKTYPCLPRAQFVTSCRQNFKNAYHFWDIYWVSIVQEDCRDTEILDRQTDTYLHVRASLSSSNVQWPDRRADYPVRAEDS